MGKETVIVFKDKKTREIKTYVNLDGHGAEVSLSDFVSLVSEAFGSPATTLTRASLLQKLQAASDAVVLSMKMQTKEVAAVNLEPPKR